MSGLLAEAPAPKAVIVALHGGATTAAYFDCPGHPELSLVRSAPRSGFTVLALDRPGFGSSALYGDEFDSTPRRIDMTYRAIEAMLGSRDRGAGVFVLAHSNGSELALRMAADDRGAGLLGVEISGTGLRQQDTAAAVLAGASRENIPTGLRELLWAARVRIPARYTLGEHERVWSTGPAAMAEIAALFTAAPTVRSYQQADGGHNLSLGHIAPTYHRSVLDFADECISTTTDLTMEAQ